MGILQLGGLTAPDMPFLLVLFQHRLYLAVEVVIDGG
jgi:hypothetical protein